MQLDSRVGNLKSERKVPHISRYCRGGDERWYSRSDEINQWRQLVRKFKISGLLDNNQLSSRPGLRCFTDERVMQ